jgi:hypothetical protein
MKNPLMIALTMAVASCGGSAKQPTEPVPDDLDDGRVEPIEDEEPVAEPEPPPPLPQQWHAYVELAPVKGAKMKPAVLRFSQVEGESASVASDAPFDGLKAGTYHLVFHEGGDCGKNATKAGAPWAEMAEALPALVIAKGKPAALDASDLSLMLDGEQTVVGHALVLHADKKGKPAKAVACGVVFVEESAGGE